jgi:glucans biosynthesis protein
VTINPMHPATFKLLPLLEVPRCGARTRAGKPCQSPAVRGRKRCRMHGGAVGSGAPKGQANGSYRHGQCTCVAIEERRDAHALVALLRKSAKDILEG